jgi:zinc transport system permease protein
MTASALLTDPLWRLPFMTGLGLALVLPVVGALLMLRDEWLAALGLAHLAAASALLGVLIGVPPVLGGPLGAIAGGVVKTWRDGQGNSSYALMLLSGWAALYLLAANSRHGPSLGQALIDGQLYFAGALELSAVLVLVVTVIAALRWLMPLLLRARLFPDDDRANHRPAWRWRLGFDLLTALAMATGAATLGLMGTFALAFVPAWVAFRYASGWIWTLVLSAALGVVTYLLAFAAALVLDQPFGPMLVALLVLAAGLGAARSQKPGPRGG